MCALIELVVIYVGGLIEEHLLSIYLNRCQQRLRCRLQIVGKQVFALYEEEARAHSD